MAKSKEPCDEAVDEIRNLLEREYVAAHPDAQVTVRRYNPWSIRIRIIDPELKGSQLTVRDGEVWEILEKLSEDTFQQVSLLFLLTPKEAKSSWVNREFEDPTPSPL
jgi:hypothetical protein